MPTTDHDPWYIPEGAVRLIVAAYIAITIALAAWSLSAALGLLAGHLTYTAIKAVAAHRSTP